jgi:hypothetical protein
MPDSWSKYFRQARAAMIVARTSAGNGPDGIALPALLPLDPFAILAQLVVPIASAIGRLGTIRRKADIGDLQNASVDQLEPLLFLAGAGASGHPTLRTIGADAYVIVQATNDDAVWDFVIQLLDDWDRLVNTCARAIKLYGGAPTAPMPNDVIAPIFAAGVAVCSDLDVLHENPPTSTWEQIKIATAKSLADTGDKIKSLTIDAAELAGKAAAEAGDIAGRAAGAAASGFFGRATAITVAVAAIAVWIVLK